jgi:hypothetical protein
VEAASGGTDKSPGVTRERERGRREKERRERGKRKAAPRFKFLPVTPTGLA